ncbi:unnamed protein product [Bursaphelenchus xylophilus]|uniref:(pine wood nematode) hypothetical protein n=1 Tax=Bursaphelenchus xylophilus TaxID=6326 RepID=A0A7I8X9G0_BURXY|nr:unnamed protein product [Bursaphelenchus xylophilus]CAG9131994.1 unnamed protein product [Bursaphelenchus xylophilus]
MTDHDGGGEPRPDPLPEGIRREEEPNSRAGPNSAKRKPVLVAKTSSLGAQRPQPPAAQVMPTDEADVQVPQVHRLSTISARVGHPSVSGLSHLPHHPLNSTVIDWNAGVNHAGSRRTSVVFSRRPTTSNVPISSNVPLRPSSGSLLELGDRTSSKLTLDEELYDILFAFGWVNLISGKYNSIPALF